MKLKFYGTRGSSPVSRYNNKVYGGNTTCLEVKTKNISSVVFSPRQEHSRKPDIIKDRIVELFGDLPRVELFARYAAPGWTQAGNGVEDLDINESIRILANK